MTPRKRPEDALPTNAEAALLGLLAEEPMHPYEIEKTVQYRDMRSWTDLSMSAIYKLLNGLEERGLVESRQEPTEGRLRRIYVLSEAGREALVQRLREVISTLESVRYQVDIGTYNLDLLPPDEVPVLLGRYREALVARIRCYNELDAFLTAEGCPPHRNALARRTVHMAEGELRWVDELLASLSKA